jgi:hypothetical protein
MRSISTTQPADRRSRKNVRPPGVVRLLRHLHFEQREVRCGDHRELSHQHIQSAKLLMVSYPAPPLFAHSPFRNSYNSPVGQLSLGKRAKPTRLDKDGPLGDVNILAPHIPAL